MAMMRIIEDGVELLMHDEEFTFRLRNALFVFNVTYGLKASAIILDRTVARQYTEDYGVDLIGDLTFHGMFEETPILGRESHELLDVI